MKVNKLSALLAGAFLTVGGSLQASGAVLPTRESNVYGFLTWAKQLENNLGWYRLTPSGERELQWIDTALGGTASYLTSAWLRDGKLCGTFGNRSQLFYMEINRQTGELLSYDEIDLESEPDYMLRYMYTSAYSPKDDCVYGFAYNTNFTRDYLVKAPAGDRANVEVVREMPDDFSMCRTVCYCDADNFFYGIDLSGWFVRFDKYGNFEALKEIEVPGETRNMADWSTGMVWSPRDRTFFWNAQYDDFGSSWVRIDPVTYECTAVKEFPIQDLFTVLCCDDPEYGDYNPELTSCTEDADGLKLTYAMPSQQADLAFAWELLVDGDTQATGSNHDGGTENVTLPLLSDGYHYFEMRILDGEGRARGNSHDTRWCGQDGPGTPAGVQLALGDNPGELHLEWTAPQSGRHGGKIETSALRYRVLLDGVEMLETDQCSATINYDVRDELKERTASVVAINGVHESEAGKSNAVTTGDGRWLPLEMTPDADDAKQVTYIGAAGTQTMWTMREDYKGNLAFYCPTNREKGTDDYLILPGIHITDASTEKDITFDIGNGSNVKKDERFELWVGDAPNVAGVRQIRLMEPTKVEKIQYTEHTAAIGLPKPGLYYIAFRCTSPADMSGIYVRNIRVVDTDRPFAGVDVVAEDTVRVSASKGKIAVYGAQGARLEVYAADGRMAYGSEVTSEMYEVSLPAGLYIVKAGVTAAKVRVE